MINKINHIVIYNVFFIFGTCLYVESNYYKSKNNHMQLATCNKYL